MIVWICRSWYALSRKCKKMSITNCIFSAITSLAMLQPICYGLFVFSLRFICILLYTEKFSLNQIAKVTCEDCGAETTMRNSVWSKTENQLGPHRTLNDSFSEKTAKINSFHFFTVPKLLFKYDSIFLWHQLDLIDGLTPLRCWNLFPRVHEIHNVHFERLLPYSVSSLHSVPDSACLIGKNTSF